MISRPTVRPIVEDSAPTSAPPATWVTVRPRVRSARVEPAAGSREPAPRAAWPGCAPCARPASPARSRDPPPGRTRRGRSDWRMSACSSSGVSGAMREAGGMSRVATTGVGGPAGIEHGHDRLADAERGQRLLEIVEVGLGKGPHGGAERRVVVRRVGAERMLDPVAELREHVVGDVLRSLGHEVDADTLRSDEPHHLLHLRRGMPSRRRRTAGAPRRRRRPASASGRSPASGRL